MVTFPIAVGKINLTLPSLTFLSAVSASLTKAGGRICKGDLLLKRQGFRPNYFDNSSMNIDYND
jgi:hypothetical protein